MSELQDFTIGLPPAPSIRPACETVMNAIDAEIAISKERINALNLLAAVMDSNIYPTEPLMAYGPIPKEEKWIYDFAADLVRNEERNIEILEKAKNAVKEKCQ